MVPPPTYPYAPASPALYFVRVFFFSLWCLVYSEKHLGSLWWQLQGFCMSNLKAEVLVTWHKNVWMKVEMLIVNVIFFCKMPGTWEPPR